MDYLALTLISRSCIRSIMDWDQSLLVPRPFSMLRNSAQAICRKIGPSKCIMKAKCLTKQDWKRHLAGFNKIKEKQKTAILQNTAAQQVTEVVNSAHNGILFIDEAYQLKSCPGVVDALVPLISQRRGQVMFIVAGYCDQMKDFMGANDGLTSRFPDQGWVEFTSYTLDELRQICEKQLVRDGATVDGAAKAEL